MIRFCNIQIAPVLLALLFFTSEFSFADTFPDYTGYVNDYAQVLTPSQRNQLEQICREANEKAGVQIAIVTMDSIPGGDVISSYATELADHWGVGNARTDLGALLFFKKETDTERRRVFLATGYGLEAHVPDGLAGEILDKYVVPHLDQGEPAIAFANAVAAITYYVNPDVQLTGQSNQYPARRRNNVNPFGLIPMIIILLLMSRSRLGRHMLMGMMLGSMMGGGRGGWGGGSGGFGGGFGGFGGGFGGFGGGGFGGGGAGR